MAYTKQNFKSKEKLYASQLNAMDDQIEQNTKDVQTLQDQGAGKDGGYYTPAVTQTAANEATVSFASSDSTMPAVASVKVTLPAGPKGDPYTLTEGDKAELVAMVIESLGGKPIFGVVDENNNIIVQGNLADGTYTVKYEMEDGSTIDIGKLALGANVYYSVTKNLANCSINNSTTSVLGGVSYSATISANSGYEIYSINVTMGGVDITATAVSGNNINIENATGNIVITAVAEEIVIVNQIPISTDANGNLFVGTNNEAGYKTGYRLNSAGVEKAQSGIEVTGFIPCTYNDTMYMKNVSVTSGSTTETMCFYDSNHALVLMTYTEYVFGGTSGEVVSKKVSEIALDAVAENKDKIAFIRISAQDINANSIITINQPIS